MQIQNKAVVWEYHSCIDSAFMLLMFYKQVEINIVIVRPRDCSSKY